MRSRGRCHRCRLRRRDRTVITGEGGFCITVDFDVRFLFRQVFDVLHDGRKEVLGIVDLRFFAIDFSDVLFGLLQGEG